MRRKQGNGKSMLNDQSLSPVSKKKKKRVQKKLICKKGHFLFTKTGQDKTSRRCVFGGRLDTPLVPYQTTYLVIRYLTWLGALC